MGVVKVVNGQPDLFEMVLALHPAGRLSSGLHRWQKQGDEHADNGNDDEEFDERKSVGFHKELGGLGVFKIGLDAFSSFRRKPEPRGTGIARNAWIPACAGMTVLGF